MSIQNKLLVCATTTLLLSFVKADSESEDETPDYFWNKQNRETYYYQSYSNTGKLLSIWLIIFSALVICSCCRRLFRFTGSYAEQNRHSYIASTMMPSVITTQQPIYPSPPNAHYNNQGFITSDPSCPPPFTNYHSPVYDAPPSYNEVVGLSHNAPAAPVISGSSGHGGHGGLSSSVHHV